MSGTSLDGVDSVLVDLQRRPFLLRAGFLPYPKTLKALLLALHETSGDELHRAALAGIELSKLYAKAADRLLEKHGVNAQAVSAIGCHGQTVRHRPGAGYSLQLGNPAWLAERTGITVVADFRSRDIAAAGRVHRSYLRFMRLFSGLAPPPRHRQSRRHSQSDRSSPQRARNRLRHRTRQRSARRLDA